MSTKRLVVIGVIGVATFAVTLLLSFIFMTEPLRISSYDSWFGRVFSLDARLWVTDDTVNIFVPSVTMHHRRGHRQITDTISMGLARTFKDSNGEETWSINQRGNEISVDRITSQGDEITLYFLHFSIPIRAGVNLGDHWIVLESTARALDRPGKTSEELFVYAHSDEGVFKKYARPKRDYRPAKEILTAGSKDAQEDRVPNEGAADTSGDSQAAKVASEPGDAKPAAELKPEGRSDPAERTAGRELYTDSLLRELYEKKLANLAYVAWQNRPGLPTGYQDFPEEQLIKAARSRAAATMTLPQGADVIRVPVRRYSEPVIDGRIGGSEWIGAAKVSIGIQGERTMLYLLSDGKNLYIACDAPGEITVSGFDQFRFYYHIKGSSVIVNERVHVARRNSSTLGGIRQTTVRWQGAPPSNEDERWKKYPISDWRIYQHAEGASSFADYRQYEAKLDLDEIGLHVDVPFAAFVEVETDPEKQNGKFVQRRYLGLLGSQAAPVWLLIDRSLAYGGTHSTAEQDRSRKAPPSKPKIYKWVDEEGRIHFSDTPGNQ